MKKARTKTFELFSAVGADLKKHAVVTTLESLAVEHVKGMEGSDANVMTKKEYKTFLRKATKQIESATKLLDAKVKEITI